VISDGYFAGGNSGWIEVICGVMFSGKSEELIRRVRRAIIAKKTVQVFKSHLDERYSGIYHISSHDGRSVEAVPVDTPEQIGRLVARQTQVVAIDEAQFLDASIVDLATALANRGTRVILGLRFSRRAVWADAAAACRRGGRGQAPRDLRHLRQSGEPQSAVDRR
jgi:thymidine kinase